MFERIKKLLTIEDEQQFKEACLERIDEILSELKEIWQSYSKLEWACIFSTIAFFIALGFVIGVEYHISLMELMNHTNGMEHTTNYLQKNHI